LWGGKISSSGKSVKDVERGRAARGVLAAGRLVQPIRERHGNLMRAMGKLRQFRQIPRFELAEASGPVRWLFPKGAAMETRREAERFALIEKAGGRGASDLPKPLRTHKGRTAAKNRRLRLRAASRKKGKRTRVTR